MISTLILRGLSMFGKFLLVILMAAKLDTDTIAEFGSFSSFIVMATYLTGYDFYIGYSRLGKNDNKPGFNSIRLLSNCIISIPILLFLFLFSELIGGTDPLVYVIIFLFSFIAQEFYRILIADGKFISSNLIFFIRSGLWCFISVGYILIEQNNSDTTLEFILSAWLISELLCCIIFIVYLIFLNSEYLLIKSFRPLLLKQVIKNQSIIFSSSLCILMMNSFDKFFLNASLEDKDFVSAYYLNSIVANSILTIIYTSLVNPRFKNFTSSELSLSKKNTLMRKFSKDCLIIGIIFSTVFIFLFDDFIRILGRTYLEENSYLKYPFTILIILNVINLIPHYYLFVFRKDKEIAKVSIISALLVIVAMPILKTFIGGLGVILSLLIGMLFMILYKSLLVIKSNEFKLS